MKEFGTCPLVQCSGQPVLPVGSKDEIGADTVKIFCPKCQCVYHPPPVRARSNNHISSGGGVSGGVDGASFGTTFPHLFLMTFSNLVPDPLPQDSAYIPRVFGFRVHQSARQQNSMNSASSPTQILSSRRLYVADGDESKRNGTDKDEAKGGDIDTLTPAQQCEVGEGKERIRSKGANKPFSRAEDEVIKQENERPKRKPESIEGGKKPVFEVSNGIIEGSLKRRKRQENAEA